MRKERRSEHLKVSKIDTRALNWYLLKQNFFVQRRFINHNAT